MELGITQYTGIVGVVVSATITCILTLLNLKQYEIKSIDFKAKDIKNKKIIFRIIKVEDYLVVIKRT